MLYCIVVELYEMLAQGTISVYRLTKTVWLKCRGVSQKSVVGLIEIYASGLKVAILKNNHEIQPFN